ncbi:uncharacterized protein LOC131958110 [Physella acuta]|uniref:uncharacterized protein LOC131958110 n=1 Tax=Physella acuta TaxID=109671 RepID=UPI0027DD743A|nr:uncharacterized protein LOC131958110 [Physella acuta]
MTLLAACLMFVAVTSLCELCMAASKPGHKNSAPLSLVKIMDHFKHQDHVKLRSRRSEFDNRIDTFPDHPVYFSPRGYDLPHFPRNTKDAPRHHLQDLLLPPSHFEMDDPKMEDFEPLDPDFLLKLPKSLDGFQKPSDCGESFKGDVDPALADIVLSEEAMKMGEKTMDEFMTFLDLKASGALDKCLLPVK